jgi:uncharacterized protein
MALCMSQVALPAFRQTLSGLGKIVQKAASHCDTRKIDATVLLQARLYPDMFDFTRQIQITSDIAKGALARLAGVEPPKWDDCERSFAELQARLERTLDYVRCIRADQIDGCADREVAIQLPSGQDLSFTGHGFLSTWALPNFFFHATTAYDILRHNGVELGKRDFLNAN